MAKSTSSKKDTTPDSSVDDIFAQLIGQHNKVSPGSAMLGTDLESEVKTWIDSGSMLLNFILSNTPDGGYPCGRIVQVFGKESIGKSTLSYVAIASIQRLGGIAIYADVEHAANKKFMEMLGVDLKKMIWTDIENLEDLFEALDVNLTTIINSPSSKGKPVLIILDSVTALQTKTEQEGGYEFNMNVSMGKAKQMGKALKKINSLLNKANACLFCIDQIRDNTSGYGDPYTVPGGRALPFYASIRLFLKGKERIVSRDPEAENRYQEAVVAWKAAGGNKNKLIQKPERDKSDQVTVGFEIQAITIKNKVAPPERIAHFQILFTEGLKDEKCFLDYAIKYGFIKKSGAYNEIVAFPNDCGKFYDSEWLSIIEDADVYLKIRDLLIDRLTVKNKIDKSHLSSEQILSTEEKAMIAELKKEEEYVD